ncbi:AimR family lysis-lysogeny pheromone receptor [Bacillus pumilus]|uniref:AimR family lysis-lysogeny pheromone receptor n=1 Tax=Bacillus pumilus TaxID=1408 RepID=UPI0011A86D54|nr:AimR family lysis-lysogeny pheromone receptor [Bacillus pumilus]
MNLKTFIKNKCEEDQALALKLAQAAGYAQRSGLYRFLNSSEKEMDNLQGVIDMVRLIAPNEEFLHMSEYIMTLDPNKSCARQGLEYLDVNKINKERDMLIEAMKSSRNALSKEWAEIYEVHKDIQDKKINYIEAQNNLSSIKTKSIEMTVFRNLMLLYPTCHNGEFGLMKEIVRILDVDMIPAGFVKDSYTCRILIMKASSNVSQNNTIEARENAKLAFETATMDRFKIFAQLHLGNSYIFENYNLAKEHYYKGLSLTDENSPFRTEMIRSLCALENIWGIKENKFVNEYSTEATDIQEVIFHNLVIGNKEKASALIYNLDKISVTDYEKAHLFFLKGLCNDDVTCYYSSIKYFKKTGDKFSINLPLVKLKEKGLDNDLLELIAI